MMEISPLIPPTVHKSYGNTLQAHRMVLLSPKPIQERTDKSTKESTHIAPPVRLASTPLPSLADVYKPSLCSKVQTCWGCTWPTNSHYASRLSSCPTCWLNRFNGMPVFSSTRPDRNKLPFNTVTEKIIYENNTGRSPQLAAIPTDIINETIHQKVPTSARDIVQLGTVNTNSSWQQVHLQYLAWKVQVYISDYWIVSDNHPQTSSQGSCHILLKGKKSVCRRIRRKWYAERKTGFGNMTTNDKRIGHTLNKHHF